MKKELEGIRKHAEDEVRHVQIRIDDLKQHRINLLQAISTVNRQVERLENEKADKVKILQAVNRAAHLIETEKH